MNLLVELKEIAHRQGIDYLDVADTILATQAICEEGGETVAAFPRDALSGGRERRTMQDIRKRSVAVHGIHATAILLITCVLLAGAVFIAGCDKREVSLQYDPDPHLAIVTVQRGGGLPFPGDDLMPVFQLFGDGRFVRYQEGSGGGGTFVQGKLDDEAVADLLRNIADAGFFDLEDEYADPDVYDATCRIIAVNLMETAKAVRVWMTRDVTGFDAVYDHILSLPVGEVTEFVPDQGYLVAVKYVKLGDENYDILAPESDIYRLLPDIETLNQAVEGRVAVAVDGPAFMQLKKYENGRGARGLYIEQPDSYLVVYPVYDPRIVDKP